MFEALTRYFDMPHHQGQMLTYLNGNSLGPKLKSMDAAVLAQCHQWGEMGVRGHFDGKNPWVSFQESLSPLLAKLVGAKSHEVCAMGTLTGNLHLLLMSFYRPTPRRYKILRLAGFPSDTYAIDSQIQQRLQTLRDFSNHATFEDAVIELSPDENGYISMERITEVLHQHQHEIALVWFEAIHYLTGQRFDLSTITQLAHQYGAMVGFDLAHAVGNIPLSLHASDVDFAVWCHYKYVCAGPGSVAGLYIHERHLKKSQFRLAGWWGNDLKTRFQMNPQFSPIENASSWQISTPEMFSLVCLREALTFFDSLNLISFFEKNRELSDYLTTRLSQYEDKLTLITPKNASQRGCQSSFSFKNKKIDASLEHVFLDKNIVCDVRPGVIRVAPTGLYNTHQDIDYFIEVLAKL